MRASKDEGPYRNRKTRIKTDTHAATSVDSGTRQKRDTMPGSASALPTHQTRRGSIKSTRSSLAEGSVGNMLTPAPARLLVSGRSAAKAKWEADKCSKHFSYRLKGKAGTKRPIPMTSVKSLAARFYRLKSGHAPTGVYLKRFGHRDDDKCWWCGGTVSQTREHLFRHCSRWRDHQRELWKAVGKATGWKAGRC
jgi:hypothetical protein